MTKTKAYLYIIIGAALWGLIGIFVKMLAADGFTPLQIVTLRTLTSAVCITPLLLKMGKHHFNIELKDLWMFIGTGLISLTFFNYCYFNCIQASSLAVAALLLYTAPAFVMLMSLFLFGEQFTPLKGVALVATFIGCGFVTGALTGELSLSFSGILYGLGSGIGYALYSIFSKFALKKYSSFTISAFTFYIAFLGSLPLADFTHCAAIWGWNTLVGALGLGLICAVFPYVLYTQGLQYVEAGQASILATIEPCVAAIVGVVMFAEPLTWDKLLGIILVVGAVVALNLPQKRRSQWILFL